MENNSARIENSISLISLWQIGQGMTKSTGQFFWKNILLFQRKASGCSTDSFCDSTTRSLIHLKVSHMVKINCIYEVMKYMSSKFNYFAPKKTTQHSSKSTQYIFKHCTKIYECFKDGRMMQFCMRGSQTCLIAGFQCHAIQNRSK